MKGLRVIELSEALKVDSSDLLAVCAILRFKASSRLSMLTFEECKAITDYYERIWLDILFLQRADWIILFNFFYHSN